MLHNAHVLKELHVVVCLVLLLSLFSFGVFIGLTVFKGKHNVVVTAGESLAVLHATCLYAIMLVYTCPPSCKVELLRSCHMFPPFPEC